MRKRSVVLFLIAIIAVPLVIFLSEGTSHSQAKKKVEKKVEKKVSCVTAKCHAKVDKVKYVHGPVSAGECAECHGTSDKHATNPQRYKFKKIEDVSKGASGF